MLTLQERYLFFIAGTCELCMSPLCESKFEATVNGYVYCCNSPLWRCSVLTSCWSSPGLPSLIVPMKMLEIGILFRPQGLTISLLLVSSVDITDANSECCSLFIVFWSIQKCHFQLCVLIDYISDKIPLLIQEYNDSMKSPVFNGLSQSKDNQLKKDLQNQIPISNVLLSSCSKFATTIMLVNFWCLLRMNCQLSF